VAAAKIVITSGSILSVMRVYIPLQNIEEDQKHDTALLKVLARVLAFLQDIEA
jgi:hypothetical protein